MEWYQIISIISAVFGILGISAYINERMKHKADGINKREDARKLKKEEKLAQLRELEHQQYKAELKEIIDTAIQPLAADISQIKSDLAKNTEGTVTLLRTDMKNSIDRYKDRGFASAGDRANWNELYITYDRLGGNHFREYVDGWKEELLNLPFKKETVARRTKTKKVLVEKK